MTTTQFSETFLEPTDVVLRELGRVSDRQDDVLRLLDLVGPPLNSFSSFSAQSWCAEHTPKLIAPVPEDGRCLAASAATDGLLRVTVLDLLGQVLTSVRSQLGQNGIVEQKLSFKETPLLKLRRSM